MASPPVVPHGSGGFIGVAELRDRIWMRRALGLPFGWARPLHEHDRFDRTQANALALEIDGDSVDRRSTSFAHRLSLGRLKLGSPSRAPNRGRNGALDKTALT